MDIIRESLSTLVDRLQYEKTTEHFVSSNNPTVDDYNRVAPYFKAYNLDPQEAFKVMMFFDKDPSTLTKQDLESRLKMLNILHEMLSDPQMSSTILKNYESLNGKALDPIQAENAKGMINLLRRLVKLLILEAMGDKEEKQSNALSYIMVLAVFIAIAMLCYAMLYKKN